MKNELNRTLILRMLFILVLILSEFGAFSQTDVFRVEKIDEYVNYIDTHLNDFLETKENVYKLSTDGGIIRKLFDNDTLVKVSFELNGETGMLYRYYYIKNDSLVYVFDERYEYNAPYYLDSLKAAEMGLSEWFNPEKTKMYVDQYYFDKNKLIKWIESEVNRNAIDPAFLIKERYYFADFEKYK